MAISSKERREKIKKRLRNRIEGTPEIPRMSVYRSNKHIAVQIIDDVNSKTLVAASSLVKDINEKKATKSEKATMVGQLIAKKAIEAGLSKVVFDRNGYLYHGKIKALADGARKGGLKF